MGLPGAAQEASGPLLRRLSSCSPGLGAAAGMPGVRASGQRFACPVCTVYMHAAHTKLRNDAAQRMLEVGPQLWEAQREFPAL